MGKPFTSIAASDQISDGYNTWKFKTVETLPDGNTNTIYSNAFGQQMLKVFTQTSTGQQWMDFYAYDDQGRMILHANPSAVTGYDESKADLLNQVSGNYQYLSDTQGLIESQNNSLNIIRL
jgi:hypothetical protein